MAYCLGPVRHGPSTILRVSCSDPKYISDPKSSRNASQDRCCWWQKQTHLLAMCAGSRLWKWPNTAGRGQLQLLFVVHLSNRVPFMCSLLLKHLRVTLRRGTNRIKKTASGVEQEARTKQSCHLATNIRLRDDMHIDNECYLSSLCNAIILSQELHASQVAADIEDVAQALLRHLEAGLFLTSLQALRKPSTWNTLEGLSVCRHRPRRGRPYSDGSRYSASIDISLQYGIYLNFPGRHAERL